MENYTLHPLHPEQRPAVRQFVREYWGSDMMVSRGKAHYPAEQEGFFAERDGRVIGLITYEQAGEDMEITLLESREREKGIGSRLVEAAVGKAQERGCRRLWLITTNDNIRAIRFYQKRGFGLVRLHYNALEASRKLKPQIPMRGQEGIPIRHELEFELVLR